MECRAASTAYSSSSREAHRWLTEVTRLLHQPIGRRVHEELLTAAGWPTLRTGCLEYDMGMRAVRR